MSRAIHAVSSSAVLFPVLIDQGEMMNTKDTINEAVMDPSLHAALSELVFCPGDGLVILTGREARTNRQTQCAGVHEHTHMHTQSENEQER